MTNAQIRRIRYACYSANVTMSATSCLSPILFLTFRERYGISFSLLGFLVLVNFFTQLLVDLALSFFSHKMNLTKTVKSIPMLALLGFVVYAALPVLFPEHAFAGLCIGTVIFSFAAGLAEVLISPVIAALPAKDPDRELSKLHSVYAWGCVAVVILGAGLLVLVGGKNWIVLPLVISILPAVSTALFAGAKIPEMAKPEKVSGALKLLCSKKVLISVFCIFLGGASECTMAQWCSGYLEKAVEIPKLWGDLFGTALFSVALGLGRSLYAKLGKNAGNALFFGALGAVVCYLAAAFTPFPLLGLVACGFCGFCVSMLWPGSLIVASGYFPSGGVFLYAMMAAGGDLGASVGPQLIGVITDFSMENPWLLSLAEKLSLSPEQMGLKLGLLVGMLFPLAAIPVYWHIKKKRG